jgi:hypothetical protein
MAVLANPLAFNSVLFITAIKSFIDETKAQYYKTFYGTILGELVKS